MKSGSKKRFGVCALLAVALAGGALTSACTSRHVTGGLIGGVAVGGAYEYQNKKALRQLERDWRSGRISAREYHRRRDGIEDRSLIY